MGIWSKRYLQNLVCVSLRPRLHGAEKTPFISSNFGILLHTGPKSAPKTGRVKAHVNAA